MFYRGCFLIVFVTLLFSYSAMAQILAHFWSQGFGDASGQEAQSVATDSFGNATGN